MTVTMKICKSSLNGVQLFFFLKILWISVSFVTVGMLYILTYSNIVARYSFTLLIGIGLFIKRDVLVKYIKSFMSVREKNN